MPEQSPTVVLVHGAFVSRPQGLLHDSVSQFSHRQS